MLQTLTQHTTNESFNEFIQQLSEVSGLNPWSRLGVSGSKSELWYGKNRR